MLLAWVLTNCLLAATITSTNAKASTAGASAAVSGYMAFLLYSVAFLACMSFSSFCPWMAYVLFLNSRKVLRVDGVYHHSDVCWGVEEDVSGLNFLGFTCFFYDCMTCYF